MEASGSNTSNGTPTEALSGAVERESMESLVEIGAVIGWFESDVLSACALFDRLGGSNSGEAS